VTTPILLHASEARVEVHVRSDVARGLTAEWAAATKPLLPIRRTVRITAVDGTVLVDGEPRRHNIAPENLLIEVDAVIYRELIAWHGPPRTVFHAAAVTHEGRTFVLAGESGAGKSSLARALVDRGARYFTDELTIFDGESVWGIGRTPQLDPVPPDETLPPWFSGYDVDMHSYRFRSLDGPRILPLLMLTADELATAPRPAGETQLVFVRRGASESLEPLAARDALAELHNMRRSEVRTDLGPLFHTPPLALSWTSTAEAARLLLDG